MCAPNNTSFGWVITGQACPNGACWIWERLCRETRKWRYFVDFLWGVVIAVLTHNLYFFQKNVGKSCVVVKEKGVRETFEGEEPPSFSIREEKIQEIETVLTYVPTWYGPSNQIALLSSCVSHQTLVVGHRKSPFSPFYRVKILQKIRGH